MYTIGNRPDARDVLLVLTDGWFYSNPCYEAALCRKHYGVQTFVIAPVNGVFEPYVRCIAGNPGRLFQYQQREESAALAELQEMLAGIFSQVCEVNERVN